MPNEGVDSLRVDSLRVQATAPVAPQRSHVVGSPRAIASVSSDELHRSTVPELRDLIRERLDLGALRAGSAHRPEPLDASIPGRDVPELRVDGLPVGPIRWPETSLSPIPPLAAGSVSLRRYAPILGPLSSTGGPVIDLTLATPAAADARSAIRLTKGSYGTFTNEIVLSRPYRRAFVSSFLGSSKTVGRQLWGRQRSQTLGARVVHPVASGWLTLGVDDAFHRSWLLSTKKGYWDRTAWILRYDRPDSAGLRFESSLQWLWLRAGWDASLGKTERRGRSLWYQGRVERAGAGGLLAAAIEADFSRVHYRRLDAEQRLLEDLSLGVAVGWEIERDRIATRASAGVVRLAPVQASPVFSLETDLRRPGMPLLTVHASRAVRNRTLPRLSTDGEAWVRQGIDLASEEIGEGPEALWRGGIEVGWHDGGSEQSDRLVIGFERLHARRTYEGPVEDLRFIGTVDWKPPDASQQRRARAYSLAKLRLRRSLRYGFEIEGSSTGAIAPERAEQDLGLPSLRWKGAIGWSGALFRRDLELDLTLRAWGQSEVATPYGAVASIEMLDGEIRGTIGSATLFFVLENLANTERDAPAFDGRFVLLPLRNYHIGLYWTFID